SIGLFVAFLPIPFQMLVAAVLAILFRVNLPISVALVWISNPLTMAPMFYFCYWLGSKLLSLPPQDITFELSIEWMQTTFLGI
ncbi:MAG: DUF2062 domain-containing protein, partial [Gammaproteobacteria bacterium]|nr:DUF2062 domain-containing protein [Gammaproteobacteria bacterium]NIR94698.1 DUF2062 domain-containing protein [Gammaproteobacteria bacterium]NIW43880.1 DUF2062 domain-containing protein [Gammaproteobacteria bacterium]NIX54988.1 DUF2062 domain-containing protein [candidate division Zixibacteria bacterium]